MLVFVGWWHRSWVSIVSREQKLNNVYLFRGFFSGRLWSSFWKKADPRLNWSRRFFSTSGFDQFVGPKNWRLYFPSSSFNRNFCSFISYAALLHYSSYYGYGFYKLCVEKNLEGKGEKTSATISRKICVRSFLHMPFSIKVGLFHFSAICILKYFQSFNSSLEKVLDIPPFFVISSMASYFFLAKRKNLANTSLLSVFFT